MKALIQRVLHARVAVNNEVISSIEQGLCIFIGISVNDGTKDMERIVRKILSAKLFEDERHKKWKKNVVEKKLEILCISQFTLYNTWKGNKPDFHNAMSGEQARDYYEKFLQLLKSQYMPEKIKDGQFGAFMQVTLTNDGPVTFEIETKPPRSQTEVRMPEISLASAVSSGSPLVQTLYKGSTPTEEELAGSDLNDGKGAFTSLESDFVRHGQGSAAKAAPSAPPANQPSSTAEEALLCTQAELTAGIETFALGTGDFKEAPQNGSSDTATMDTKPDNKGDAKETQASQDSSEATNKDSKPRTKNDANETQISQGGAKKKLEEETRV